MQQYLDLLKAIKEKGTKKPAARKGMPGTTSLFGYQFRHNLQEGFPLLTTKEMFWKGIVVELLWFLRGDTNIKYLVDNGVNIWNEDAYNYYLKVHKKVTGFDGSLGFNSFIEIIKDPKSYKFGLRSTSICDPKYNLDYKLGDCGYQYGKVWRGWQGELDVLTIDEDEEGNRFTKSITYDTIDQIKNLIEGLRNNPESRRHIVTSIDPAHDNDLALYWCHCLMQFNCRPLTLNQRNNIKSKLAGISNPFTGEELDELNIPKYYLDCQLYQRSADVFLGVPFNIASYALLTHILAKMCNMVPGELIHTFGDVHIYDNHFEAVEEQLSRQPKQLPTLEIHTDISLDNVSDFENWHWEMFKINDYSPHSKIKAKLSTGLSK